MTGALADRTRREPAKVDARAGVRVEVRCPACNTPVMAIVPVEGSAVTTRCSDRRCRAWIMVIVPVPVDVTAPTV